MGMKLPRYHTRADDYMLLVLAIGRMPDLSGLALRSGFVVPKIIRVLSACWCPRCWTAPRRHHCRALPLCSTGDFKPVMTPCLPSRWRVENTADSACTRSRTRTGQRIRRREKTAAIVRLNYRPAIRRSCLWSWLFSQIATFVINQWCSIFFKMRAIFWNRILRVCATITHNVYFMFILKNFFVF